MRKLININYGKLYSKARYELNKRVFYYLGNGRALSPSVLFIAVNTTCNLRCEMCDAAKNLPSSTFTKNAGTVSENAILSFDNFKNIVDNVKFFQPSISLTSREPLLHPDIARIVGYVKENVLHCSLTTNGVFLVRHAESLVKLKLDDIFISLDGTKAVHEKIRGKIGIYEQILDGIERIKHFKKQYGIRSPKMHIIYTISNSNFHNLVETVEAIKEKGLSSITFSHLNFITEEVAQKHNLKHPDITVSKSGINGQDLDRIDIPVLLQQLKDAKKLGRASGIRIYTKILSRDLLGTYYCDPEKVLYDGSRCQSPWVMAQITARGEVIPRMRCFNVVFGNIHKSSFRFIWNNSNFRDFRKKLKRNGVYPACLRCSEIT